MAFALLILRLEVETKLTELRAVMQDERIQQTGEKLLIFTESRETLEYLAEKRAPEQVIEVVRYVVKGWKEALGT